MKKLSSGIHAYDGRDVSFLLSTRLLGIFYNHLENILFAAVLRELNVCGLQRDEQFELRRGTTRRCS